jgi:protein-L-isoaspartate(D-aspartate) O-methyltransferase
MAGALDPKAQGVDPFAEMRREMVDQQIRRRQVRAPNVLKAMEEVPRHRFVPEHQQSSAYVDSPLPIGDGQTISQPYVVALMTELLELDADSTVLEIGTGSGYQAAVLSRIAKEVYSIEIRESLGEAARRLLEDLGYENVRVRIGDGYQGWPEAAPFDGIIVTAAPERVPQPLVDQLRIGGRMVVPVGRFLQELLVITKTEDGIQTREVAGVRFVPMIGEVEKPPR